MTVRQLLQSIDSRELSEWMAYDQMEPFGEERADLRAGIITSMIHNVNIVKGKPASPIDFMPEFDRQPKKKPGKQTTEDQLALARQIAAVFGVQTKG
jgi:hypothetical protein